MAGLMCRAVLTGGLDKRVLGEPVSSRRGPEDQLVQVKLAIALKSFEDRNSTIAEGTLKGRV